MTKLLQNIIALSEVKGRAKKVRKEEIIQNIIDYLQNDKAKYAIMLYGDWGSGKTYLYKNGIAEAIKNIEYGKNKERRKSEVYISLYGISSVEDLTKEIVVNFILKNKMNENGTSGKILKGAGKMIGIVSKMVSFSINDISFDFSNISEIFQENIDYENMVICFDDLERCSIPINDIFGVINNLVEHCNCKVIIISDENNIGKMYANTNIEQKYLSVLNGRKIKSDTEKKDASKNTDEQKNPVFEEITIEELKALNERLYSENFLYKDIKEKVIGYSLKYDLDLEEEYDGIVEESVSGSKLQKFLKEEKNIVLECMNKCDNKNIRIIKNWLVNFDRIYRIVDRYYANENPCYVYEVHKRFMIYSLRVACAIGKNKNLYNWDKETKISCNVYLDDEFLFDAEGYWFIDRLFRTSTLEEKDVCHAAGFIIKVRKEEEERNKKYFGGECLGKLGNWMYLEDEEIAHTIEGLFIELKEQKYVYQHYQRIISLLIYLQSKKLYDGDIKEFLKVMVKNIKNEEDEIDVEKMNTGLEGTELNKVFIKYYGYIDKFIESKNQETNEKRMETVILMKEESWSESFEKYCKDNSNNFLKNRKFIQYIDLQMLLEKLKTAKTKEVYNVVNGFSYVYRYENINEFYAGDALKLEKFIKRVESCEWEGVTKGNAINKLIDILKLKLIDINKPIDSF